MLQKHFGLDSSKEFIVSIIPGLNKYVGSTINDRQSRSTGSQSLSFTVRQTTGCFQEINVDASSSCGELYDNNNPTSPCLNQKCWNLGASNNDGTLTTTDCLDVQVDYCKSDKVTASTYEQNKGCFLLSDLNNPHRSDCPFEWGKLKDDNNDETLSPCHAHQCYENALNGPGNQNEPRSISHVSRLEDCIHVVNTYCSSRLWEPYCYSEITTSFPPLELGIKGCEHLFFKDESTLICRSPQCNTLTSHLNLLRAPSVPIRYLKITPLSKGTRGTLTFRGLMAPFVYPEVGLRFAGSHVMIPKKNITNKVRIELSVESNWKQGDIQLVELIPSSSISSYSSSSSSFCDMPRVSLTYNEEKEWLINIDKNNTSMILETRTRGTAIIVFNGMDFHHKTTKYFDTRETNVFKTNSVRRLPIVVHTVSNDFAVESDGSSVFGIATIGNGIRNALGWRISTGSGESSSSNSTSSKSNWVTFVSSSSVLTDIRTVVKVSIQLKSDNVFDGTFVLSYRSNNMDDDRNNWVIAGSTSDVSLQVDTSNKYEVILENIVAHGLEWKLEIKELRNNDSVPVYIKEVEFYTHLKSIINGTDGTEAIKMVNFIQTIDTSDIVVVAAPYGSHYHIGFESFTHLKLIGATELEATSLGPWSIVGRKVMSEKRSATTFRTKIQKPFNSVPVNSRTAGKVNSETTVAGLFNKYDFVLLPTNVENIRPGFIDGDGDGDFDIIITGTLPLNGDKKMISSWKNNLHLHPGFNHYTREYDRKSFSFNEAKIKCEQLGYPKCKSIVTIPRSTGSNYEKRMYRLSSIVPTSESCSFDSSKEEYCVDRSATGSFVAVTVEHKMTYPVIYYYTNIGNGTYIRHDEKVKQINFHPKAWEVYPTVVKLRGNNMPSDLILVEVVPSKINYPYLYDRSRKTDSNIIKIFRFTEGILFELDQSLYPWNNFGTWDHPLTRPHLSFGKLKADATMDVLVSGVKGSPSNGLIEHYNINFNDGTVQLLNDFTGTSSISDTFNLPTNIINFMAIFHDLNRDGLLDVVVTFELVHSSYKREARVDAWVNQGTRDMSFFVNINDGVYKMKQSIYIENNGQTVDHSKKYCKQSGGVETTSYSSGTINNHESCKQACLENIHCKHVSITNTPIFICHLFNPTMTEDQKYYAKRLNVNDKCLGYDGEPGGPVWNSYDKIFEVSTLKIPSFNGGTFPKPFIATDTRNFWLGTVDNLLYDGDSLSNSFSSSSSLYYECDDNSRDHRVCSTGHYNAECVTKSDSRCFYDTSIQLKKWNFQCNYDQSIQSIQIGITDKGIYGRSIVEKKLPKIYSEKTYPLKM